MQSQKMLRPKLNDLKTQEQTSFFSDAQSFLRQPMKRFNRSSTSSRSKSREDEKQQASTRFFIKSICSQTSINPQKNTAQEQKLMKILDKAIKREATPVKSKRVPKDTADSQFLPFQQTMEKEIHWLKLERRCQLAEAENLKLIKANNQMHERIDVLEGQLSEAIHQKLYFEEKVKEHDHKGHKDYKQRGNSNLIRLKREIAKQRDLESTPPSHIIQQQLDLAQSELLILRDSLARSERLRRQAQSHAQNHRNERETFLQDLVQQLKLELSEKEEGLERVKTQLNVLRLRQAKKEDKVQLAKSQELQTLKRKYGNILKKYHEATQELTAYRRKQQRLNYMLETSSNSSSRRSLQNSLSLSP